MLKKGLIGGFGLVEVLIGFMLVGMLSFGVMKMMSGSMKGARNLAQSMGHQATKGNLAILLANPDVCKDTFTGLPFGTTSPLAVKRGTNTFIQAGAAFDGMTVSRLDANISPIGSGSVALATVTLETTRDASSQMAGAKKAETVYVNLLTNGTTLTRCAGTDTFPFQKTLATSGVVIPTAGKTYTASGTSTAAFADYTTQGNFLHVTFESTVTTYGINNGLLLYITTQDLTSGAWLDGPVGLGFCTQASSSPTVTTNTCSASRLFGVVPGHTVRFAVVANAVISSPGAAAIPGHTIAIVRDQLNP